MWCITNRLQALAIVGSREIVDRTERLQVLKEIVKKFPSVNYEVFKYVIGHLNRVSHQSRTNFMTADNLSICFWPTLMRPDFENKDTLSTTKLNQSVIESFIQQCQYFFYNGEIVETSNPVATPPPAQMSNAGHMVVANVHQMALERRVGPVLDLQVCSPDCPEGLSCRNTAQYPANCSVRFLSPLANN
ncbi:UNVERIFIED_CONTAM: hypothetical protein FKN15_073457 [Acipenser sinensis]